LKLELLSAMRVADNDIRARNVSGHEVGRELDAIELHVQRFGQRSHQQRFTQSGHAFQQRVSSGEEADHNFVDNVAMTDDYLTKLSSDRRILSPEGFYSGGEIRFGRLINHDFIIL
jgi:hypothetical protein